MSKKNIIITIAVAFVFFIACLVALRFLTPEDTWVCNNGAWERHGNPSSPAPSSGCGNENINVEVVTTTIEFEENTTTNTAEWHEYSSAHNVKIRLFDFYENKEIAGSPLVITGEAPGTWFFEASFPVTLTDWDGRIIGEAIAQATSDWMTTEMVPFSITLNFEKPSLYPRGSIIFKKDNPSGLPENDDYLEFMIKYKDINPTPTEN